MVSSDFAIYLRRSMDGETELLRYKMFMGIKVGCINLR